MASDTVRVSPGMLPAITMDARELAERAESRAARPRSTLRRASGRLIVRNTRAAGAERLGHLLEASRALLETCAGTAHDERHAHRPSR